MMDAQAAGLLAVGAYHRKMWEATRDLWLEYVASTGGEPPFEIPAWSDLDPEIQASIVDLGKDTLDTWDRIVLDTSEHYTHGHH